MSQVKNLLQLRGPMVLGSADFQIPYGPRSVAISEISRVATSMMMVMRQVLIEDVADPDGKDRNWNNGGYVGVMLFDKGSYVLTPFGLPKLETYRDTQRFALEKMRRLRRTHVKLGHVTSAESARPDRGQYAGAVISLPDRKADQRLTGTSGLPGRGDECMSLGLNIHFGLMTVRTARRMADRVPGNIYIEPFFRRLDW